jgi:hypothetical protein
MFILYLAVLLITGISAVACLVWSGFLMKERKRRYELARLGQQRKVLVVSDEGKTLQLHSSLLSAEAQSITESTKPQLQDEAVITRSIERG